MQNNNVIPSTPQLADVINYALKGLKTSMSCMHIGTIESFDGLTQTATVSVNYTKTKLVFNTGTNTSVEPVEFPNIEGCPVFIYGGGGGSLRMPISSGDECLILFNDRDMSNWWGTGDNNSPPATPRSHAYSDAVVLVGVNSLPNILASYKNDAVELDYLGNLISIQQSKIIMSLLSGVTLELDSTGKLKITNLVGEFVSSLVQLFTDVQNATTNTIFGPQPLIMPTYPVDLAVLQSFKG